MRLNLSVFVILVCLVEHLYLTCYRCTMYIISFIVILLGKVTIVNALWVYEVLLSAECIKSLRSSDGGLNYIYELLNHRSKVTLVTVRNPIKKKIEVHYGQQMSQTISYIVRSIFSLHHCFSCMFLILPPAVFRLYVSDWLDILYVQFLYISLYDICSFT